MSEGIRLKNEKVVKLVIAVVLVSVLLGYVYDRNGGSFDFSDTQVRIVISGSMDGEPREQYEIETIPVKSMVFISEVPTTEPARSHFYQSLEVGDVLTFDYTHPVSHEHMVVTHRIVDIQSSGAGYTFTLAGDSIRDDPTNSSTQTVTSWSGDVIGEVTGVAPWLGALTVFISTTTGKVVLVLIPCIVLIASETRNIVRILRGKDDGEQTVEDGSVEASAVVGSDAVPEVDVTIIDRVSQVFNGIKAAADGLIVRFRGILDRDPNSCAGSAGADVDEVRIQRTDMMARTGGSDTDER